MHAGLWVFLCEDNSTIYFSHQANLYDSRRQNTTKNRNVECYKSFVANWCANPQKPLWDIWHIKIIDKNWHLRIDSGTFNRKIWIFALKKKKKKKTHTNIWSAYGTPSRWPLLDSLPMRVDPDSVKKKVWWVNNNFLFPSFFKQMRITCKVLTFQNYEYSN